jgi:tetratricopeptide (TPR) repeat protein
MTASPSLQGNRWTNGLDRAVTGGILLFAFLAASFPVRNGDFWQHLATGRLVASGQYAFGVDPFACTTEGVYWANHAWLFDLLLYWLSDAVGGAGLVLIKALVVVALAWTMMRIRPPDGPGWLLAACTGLAILAMSPRLLMQPACVSYFLLGVTLWLLWRGGRGVLLVPILCALWVNVDGWFFLGPLLVGLVCLGDLLMGRMGRMGRMGSGRVPWWLVPACVVACLCSPHHLRAFVLPLELSYDPGVIALRHDPRFQPLFASPWESGLRIQTVTAVKLAVYAYFVLLTLGLVSFVWARRELPAWRVLVWLVFAALGAWQARLIPFFAIIAAPITSLNFHSLAGEQTRSSSLVLSLTPRLIVSLCCLALLALAWPGWLQGFQSSERHAGWAVEPNASLLRSTQTLRSWREEGRIPRGEIVLAVHPDVAHYWAWFCPDEKGFVDHRFTLFGSVAAEYEEVCRSLIPVLATSAEERRPTTASSRTSWRQALRNRGIRFAVLYDPDPIRFGSALPGFAGSGGEWELCAVDGQALLLRWNDPEVKRPGDSDRLDPDRLVFARADDEGGALPAAPGSGPTTAPAARSLWSTFLDPTRPPAWESAAASVYLRLFDERAAFERQQVAVRLWARLATSVVGLAPGGTAGPSGLDVLVGLCMPGAFQSLSDRPSPALPLLAIRAARRALAENPSDAGAALALGQAYFTMGAVTGEAEQGGPHAPLPRLRHVQAVAALNRALVVRPEFQAAHAALAELYLRREYLDAALVHRQAQVRLVTSRSRTGEDDSAYSARREGLERSAEELEKVVQDRQHQFTVQSGLPSTGTDPVSRARLALRLGLPVKALEVLERSHVEVFGSAGARLELELLLMLGRAWEAREKLYDAEMQANKHKLGVFEWPVFDPAGRVRAYRLPAYEFLCLWESAANGDYDRAEELLTAIGERLRAEEDRASLPRLRSALAETVTTEIGLGCSPSVLAGAVRFLRKDLSVLYSGVAQLPDERADIETIAGLLALERGMPRLAGRHLRQALEIGRNFVALPVARVYTGRLKTPP